MRAAVLLAVMALACTPTRPKPVPTAIEPAHASAGAVVDVAIRGTGFFPALTLDFDRPSRSKVASTFTATLGEMPLENLAFLDEQTLHARVPGALAPGTYTLTVTDPSGKSGVLADAFTVSVEHLTLFVESAGAGVGTEIRDVQLRVGTPLGLSAVGRRDTGEFARDVVDATWTTTSGALTADGGPSVELVLYAPGSAVVTARSSLGTDSTGTITALACSSNAQCLDRCHSSASCDLDAGACVLGPVDKDSDTDGYVDAQCPGGSDCDDSTALVNPNVTEGPAGSASCADGLDNDCSGLADSRDPSCAASNTPPVPRFTITPDAGQPGDLFTGSAAASADAEDPLGALTFEWDWDGNGRWDATGLTSTHRFQRQGTYTVVLRVTDSAGARAIARVLLPVNTVGSATVTTALDENNPNATPPNPGGTGFSLREAITWANTVGGGQTITVPSGMTISLTSRLPALGDHTSVRGPGAIIDGAGIPGASGACLSTSGDNVTITGLELRNCRAGALDVQGDDTTITNCLFHDSGHGVLLSGGNDTLGPGNDVFDNTGVGVDLDGRAVVLDNTIHGNAAAGVSVRRQGAGSRLIGNVVYDNQVGIDVSMQTDNVRVYFNTLHANATSGLAVASQSQGHDVRDNVFTFNGRYGIDAVSTALGTLDANDFFQNLSGPCRMCATLGPKSLAVDPLYTNAATRDLHPLTTSPVINAAIDVGVDRNGARSGNFDGAAPDMGAYEVR